MTCTKAGGIAVLIAMTGNSPHDMVKLPRRYQSFVWLAEACAYESLPFLVTTPKLIHLGKDLVRGWQWMGSRYVESVENQWVLKQTSLRANVIYDAMYLSDLSENMIRHSALLRGFQKNHVTFFNPPLYPKDQLFKKIENMHRPGLQIPFTRYHVYPEMVLKILDETPSIWFKPTKGSGGRNMLWIRKIGQEKYEVKGDRFFHQRINEVFTRKELLTHLQFAKKYRQYMVQEHIELLQTQDGRPVDFRYTVQRGKNGAWHVSAMIARYGVKDSRLTNYHAGGSILSCTIPSKQVCSELHTLGLTMTEISFGKMVALAVAKILEQEFPMVGLLGIDIGMNQQGETFVYDCNSRPGRDILNDRELQDSLQDIAGFAKFLQQNGPLN